jgi:hypothetical protein
MEHESPERELSSWKEISSYLKISVRTAQMWERERGLPVRRLPGGRGRVSITAGEIAVWKHSADPAWFPDQPHPRSEDLPAAPKAALRNRIALLGVILLAVGTGVGGIVALPHHAVPAGFRIERDRLIVTDAYNRELWWKPLDNPAPTYTATNRDVWFGDLDGDGRTEVLFRWHSGQPKTGAVLICYAQDGRERWRFLPGRTVHTSKETFDPPYGIQNFAVARMGHGQAMRIVVASQHYLYYPSQIALLSPDGAIVREYWHSGGLPHLLLTDLDEDGVPEILLAGVNNAAKAATLVVLNPATMGGASTEDKPEYQLQGFGPGQEKVRLIFPRSCMNKLLEPFAYVASMWREPAGIGVEVHHRLNPETASVFYHLNRDLSLKMVAVGSSFEQSHKELYTTGLLHHIFDAKEAAELRDILYRRSPANRAASFRSE